MRSFASAAVFGCDDLKYIFRNFKDFIRNERLIFVLVALCSLTSAIVLCFSYGLYYHYQTEKTVGETDSSAITFVYSDMMDARKKRDAALFQSRLFSGPRLTAAQIKTILDSFPLEVWKNNVDVDFTYIYDASETTFTIYSDGAVMASDLYLINTISKYDVSTGSFTMSAEDEKRMNNPMHCLSGRHLTAEDVVYGRRLAVLDENMFQRVTGSEKPYNEYETPPTIELFGEPFEIIGIQRAPEITIPVTAVPDGVPVDGFLGDCTVLYYDLPVSHNQYMLVKERMEEAYPGILEVRELKFAQTDAIYYNTVIGISVFVAAVAALNFAILYQFVVMNRRKMIAVFGCCGCTRRRISRIFLGELMTMTLPLLLVGMVCYQYLILPLLTERFVYIAGAYSLKLYGLIFAIFAVITLLLVRIMLHRYISRLPVDCLKGGDGT